jgi:hypothetical protein
MMPQGVADLRMQREHVISRDDSTMTLNDQHIADRTALQA